MKSEFGELYYKYKRFLIPLALNLASVFIVFWIIMPQFSSIPEQWDSIKVENQNIQTLKSSLAALVNADDIETDSNFVTATHALPTVKDIAIIFEALTQAGANSNTALESFALNVGGVHGRAAESVNSTGGGAPTVVLTAQVSGPDARSLLVFSSELTKSLPLSEINQFNLSDTDANYEIGFFYKPYDLSKVRGQDKIVPLTQTEANLLQQLKEWEQ